MGLLGIGSAPSLSGTLNQSGSNCSSLIYRVDLFASDY